MSEARTIKVDYLARVGGEGALTVVVKDGVAQDVRLSIFEPPRFYEGFLRGRGFREVPDITARICGELNRVFAPQHSQYQPSTAVFCEESEVRARQGKGARWDEPKCAGGG